MTETLEKLQERALTFPEKASSIIVHNDETLRAANGFAKGIKSMIKEIQDAFRPMKQKTNEAHKVVVAQERDYLEPLLQAEKSVKLQIGTYVRKVQEKIREKEREAREAELKRLQEQAKREAEAQRFENHGHLQEAEEIRKQEPEAEVVRVPDAPSLDGIQVKKRLTFEILDESKVPDRFKTIDRAKIRAYIKEIKEIKGNESLDIPGIRIFYDDSVAVSTGD